MTRTRVLLAAGLLVVVAGVVVLLRALDQPAAADLTVDWSGSEGGPACVYDGQGGTVEATLLVTGEVPETTPVTLTVTAYADEDTSEAVGSGTETVEVDGTVEESVVVTFPVESAPYVDIDGVTACSQSVGY